MEPRRFWSQLYRDRRDAWELGRAAPPLVRWIASQRVTGARVLVVGCGRGHEARLFAAAGARVVGVDLVPEVIEEARALAARDGVEVDLRVGDLFALAAAPERYDLVVEHCCFCAIDPALRPDYVQVVADVLVDGGRLVGLFWAHGRPGGPPFSVDATSLVASFEPRFALDQLETPADSVASRAGEELLAQFRRR
jgi:SAM-dependent methyltransferase